MKFGEVIVEMSASKNPKVAVLKRDGALDPIYITIIRPNNVTEQFVQLRGNATYTWIDGAEVLSDKWEWA